MHNIEHQIWYALRKAAKNPLKRFIGLRETRLLARFENNALSNAQGLLPIAETDSRYVHKKHPTIPAITIPFTVNPSPEKNLPSPLPQHFFHLAAMDWQPNQQAMQWWYREIWPLLKKVLPHAQFSMAGKAMPDYMKQWNTPDFHVTGEVVDAKSFMQNKGVLVVPLQHGSGIRIKIIEAMQWGVPVIATSKALEGLNVTHLRHVCIANNAEEFCAAAVFLQQPTHYASMQQNALQWINTELNIHLAQERLHAFILQNISQPPFSMPKN